MVCKRCGNNLPASGFNCPHCGVMMDNEQIKYQKEMMNNNIRNTQMVSEKYGLKKFIFQKREEVKTKFIGLILIVGILFAIVVFAILVYLG